MRIFKTQWFAKFARREGITNSGLRDAIDRAERGLIDAELGGGLIKQRVARQGKGRSGGYRTIIAYRVKDRAVFLYGFAKSEQENIDFNQLATARKLAGKWLTVNADQIAQAIVADQLQEITND
jgi:hypothetical protein